jgi:hypothetical protein
LVETSAENLVVQASDFVPSEAGQLEPSNFISAVVSHITETSAPIADIVLSGFQRALTNSAAMLVIKHRPT